MIQGNPRFHAWSNDELIDYALSSDRQALRAYVLYRAAIAPVVAQQHKLRGQWWRSEYWAAINELAFRLNPVLDRNYLKGVGA